MPLLGLHRRLVAAFTSCYLRHRDLSCSCSCSCSYSATHPLVAALHASTLSLLRWTKAPLQEDTAAWIRHGVDLLTRLLAALTDLLQHPHARPPCTCTMASPWVQRLLHDLLLLADAHACFFQELLSLKHLLADAQSAVRRRDAARLAAALRARRPSDRALSRLASKMRALSRRSSSPAEPVSAATSVAASASTAIFARLASALQAFTSSTAAATPMAAIESLRNLEDCVAVAEDGSEEVRRALVNTRVSTLNVLTAHFLPL